MAFGKKLFFAALFISLLMESQTTSKDPWSGSFAWYFHADLKSWIPQTGLPLNPLEITIIVILLAWALRGRRDRRYHFEKGLLFWPIIGLTTMLAYGLLWGAIQSNSDFTVALWEIRALAYCVIAYFLVGILFTHRRDLDTLTWVILISILLMAVECLIRYFFFLPGRYVGDLDYDHEDTTLLSFAILLAAAMILLGSTRRQRIFALTTIPLDLLAMMVTHRRAGFASLLTGAIFLCVILFRVNRRLFLKIVPITALIFGIYLGAYWGCSGGTLCQPARAISSQFSPDPRDLQSDQYRLLEKENLILNIQVNPITGLGFGQPFAFYIPLPNLSFWPFWHYTPHNEILWVWMEMGFLGFFVFWWLIGSSIYRGGRLVQALSAAGDDKARALLAAGVCLIVMQITVSYVDLGLTSDRAMLLLGVVLGVIGHLPGILRRSVNVDDKPRAGKGGQVLEMVTPEVQAGVLAHVLVTPVDPSSPRRTVSRPRPAPRWARSEGETAWPRTSRPTAPNRERATSLSNAADQAHWTESGSRWIDRSETR